MSPSDYLSTFYSVIAGLTATVYIQKWGELLQMRRYALYVTVPVLWSICFFLMVINEWFANFRWEGNTNSFQFLMFLLIPFLLYFIGMLIFPTKEMLDRKDKYAYLDYYEHFRQNKNLIMSLALVVFFINFFSIWYYSSSEVDIFNGFWIYLLYKRNFLIFGALLLSLVIENKWFLLLFSFVMLYVWATTWVYARLSF